ncbi:MAG: proline--tRNA ligase [Candidatus Calescibacterium sp.]|nr:proline--tRNA ligase [Candidatus Calescibacterium sp.]MDW8086912.1 proline--tRNA ligase [Candidatus Calescibacterium sp.]
MKVSELFAFSFKEEPKDAESKSNRIMLKGGYIKKVAAGLYSLTPLAYKLLSNISGIIREEMQKIGCQEILLPMMTPAELWKETGRWDIYGKELIRFKDRNEREFCLAPTHEEIVVDLVRYFIKSWRDLPFSLFQIGQKFRDEPRPRFGIIRCKEFVMKDAYSFDRSEEDAEKTYWKFYEAYRRIFERLRLDVIPVQASVGAIGGKFSHEFIFITEYGEDKIMFCSKCSFVSKKEISDFFIDVENCKLSLEEAKTKVDLPRKIPTPETTTVEKLAEYLKIPTSKIIKSLFVKTRSGKYILCLVRGDRFISEDKLSRVLEEDFEIVDEKEVRSIFGAGKGFIGPLKYKGRLIVDRTVLTVGDGVVGADEDDFHFINVVPMRDFHFESVEDISFAEQGDVCPSCREGKLYERTGLELGHVFYLGYKYSKPMDLKFIDKDKNSRYVVMGCYGIGVSRTMAAIFENYGDKSEIKFPFEIAPFKIHIIPVNIKDKDISDVSFDIYHKFENIALIDDRDEVSPGEKFADCDLWGAPIKVVVGKLLKEQGKVEIINRFSGQRYYESVQEVFDRIHFLVEQLLPAFKSS